MRPPRPAPGSLPGQVQQVITTDNGYLQAVGSTLQSPTVSGASQLDGLATGAQSAFDGISNVIPAASSSVTGSGNLGSWARGAARPHKPKAQSGRRLVVIVIVDASTDASTDASGSTYSERHRLRRRTHRRHGDELPVRGQRANSLG